MVGGYKNDMIIWVVRKKTQKKNTWHHVDFFNNISNALRTIFWHFSRFLVLSKMEGVMRSIIRMQKLLGTSLINMVILIWVRMVISTY